MPGRAKRLSKIRKSLGSDAEAASPPAKKSRHESATTGKSSETKSASGQQGAPSVDDDECLKCTICGLATNVSRTGQTEEMLVCNVCKARSHPSCLDYTEELTRRASRSPWQCIECKTCNICSSAGDPDVMLVCDFCDKGYHMNCHTPSVQVKPVGKWSCCQCVLELGLEDGTEIPIKSASVESDIGINKDSIDPDMGGASCLPTPRESPVSFHEEIEDKKISAKLNGDIVVPLPRLATTLKGEAPDASDWSVADVARYFADLGFIDQAEAFREQEIDGKSLLLMTRNDVLTGLSIKLGPALKVYAHVQRLQMRDN